MSFITIAEKFEDLQEAFSLVCQLIADGKTKEAIDLADTYADVLDGSASWLLGHSKLVEARNI